MKIDHTHYDALGQEIRFQIAKWLSKYPHLQPKFFSDMLGVSMSSVSQHLDKMERVGLVKGQPEGRYVHYRLTNLGRKMIK